MIYDNTEDFFDPKPATIPRVSRVLGIVKWIGGAVLIVTLGICFLSVAAKAFLMWPA